MTGASVPLPIPKYPDIDPDGRPQKTEEEPEEQTEDCGETVRKKPLWLPVAWAFITLGGLSPYSKMSI